MCPVRRLNASVKVGGLVSSSQQTVGEIDGMCGHLGQLEFDAADDSADGSGQSLLLCAWCRLNS